MNNKSAILFSVLVSVFVTVHATSTVICPKQEDAVVLLGTTNITVEAQPFTAHVRTGRLPQLGFYDTTISCILIVDTTYDASPGVVQLISGGLNQRYAEVKLTSQIGKRMSYVMQVYSKGSQISANANLNSM